MRILLTQAPGGAYRFTPPIGLGYLAATLEHKHVVKIVDCNVEKNFKKQILDFQPEILGLSVLSFNYYSSVKLSQFIREELPECIIISGGPQATLRPNDMFVNNMSDFVVAGEGELVLSNLVKAIENGGNYKNIKGIGFLEMGMVQLNPRENPIINLDSLPFPAVHFFNLKKYTKSPQGFIYKKLPFFLMFTSRGCPFNCTFCNIHILWGRGWRYRSAKNVVDEIEHLHIEHGVNEIHFQDDNFTLNRQRVIDICNGIIERRLNISWKCPQGVRVDSLDKDLLKLMAEAGCYSLSFGIESGNQHLLDRVKKGVSLEKVAQIVKWSKDAGIFTEGFFILGLPGETKTTAMQTINFAKKIDLDAAVFTPLVPCENTPIYDEYRSKGYIKDFSYLKNYDASSVVIDLPELSSKEIETLRIVGHIQFYFRPKIIWGMLKQIKTLQGLICLVKGLPFLVKSGG